MRLKPLQRCREWIISGAWVMWTNRLLTPRFTVAWRVAKANAFDVLTKSTFRPHADSILLPRGKLCKNHFFTSSIFCAAKSIRRVYCLPKPSSFINSNVTTLSHEKLSFLALTLGCLWCFSISLSLTHFPRRDYPKLITHHPIVRAAVSLTHSDNCMRKRRQSKGRSVSYLATLSLPHLLSLSLSYLSFFCSLVPDSQYLIFHVRVKKSQSFLPFFHSPPAHTDEESLKAPHWIT